MMNIFSPTEEKQSEESDSTTSPHKELWCKKWDRQPWELIQRIIRIYTSKDAPLNTVNNMHLSWQLHF